MTNALTKLLAEREWLLADGATGTTLFNMGLMSGDAPELWNTDKPDNIRKLYAGAVDAGSDLFLTNSFGGNASRLKLHDAQSRVRELNKAAAEIGREVADASGRTVVVAGSVGPTGDILEPVGTRTHAEAAEMFEEQGAALLEGGADVLWVETISSEEEMAAAADAFARLNAPWCGTMSFDTAGRTMMGVTSERLAQYMATLPHQPIAFGANCGVGSSDLLRTVRGFAAASSDQILIAKGNAGIPKYVEGSILYDGTPELMSDYAIMARNLGARIIGGCCGTTPEHLSAMRAVLEATPKSEAPGLDEIAAKLGGFSSDSDGTGAAEAAPARPRRRRRG
ncbi:MAG: betaine--homocysteine S-methyltransferase [Pseudomonadota bacterium]